MVSNNLYQIVHNYHENHLSHAFLVETNDPNHCLNDIKDIIKEINCEQKFQQRCNQCNLCHLIEIEQLPSLEIIRLEGQYIKKEQILQLKQKFSTKPIFSKYNIYVIMNSEKFNSSSANTILKFLEEPENGIIGFFLTNNKENIIDTIKSRCQIISAFYEIDNSKKNIENLAIQYLIKLHKSNDISLLINRDFFQDMKFQKDDYQQLFQTILYIYREFYYVSLNLNSLPEKYNDLKFLLKNDSIFFLKQLNLVEQLESELSYNVNTNLLLDRFVLETRS